VQCSAVQCRHLASGLGPGRQAPGSPRAGRSSSRRQEGSGPWPPITITVTVTPLTVQVRTGPFAMSDYPVRRLRVLWRPAPHRPSPGLTSLTSLTGSLLASPPSPLWPPSPGLTTGRHLLPD
jgi:hypothetical protein